MASDHTNTARLPVLILFDVSMRISAWQKYAYFDQQAFTR